MVVSIGQAVVHLQPSRHPCLCAVCDVCVSICNVRLPWPPLSVVATRARMGSHMRQFASEV